MIEEQVSFRVSKSLLDRIDKVIEKNKGLFSSRSLFIRAALFGKLQQFEVKKKDEF